MFVRRLFTSIALIAAAVSLPVTASAQQGGVKAGVNFATLTDADDAFIDNGQRIGLVGGLFVVVPATERFAFQVEGLYSEKGLSIQDDELGIAVDGDLRIQYLEIPVLGRASFGAAGSSARVYAVAGAAPAFKLGARIKVEALDEEETEDLSDDVESMDLGLVGGLGLEFGSASIEARYTHGLLSIAKDAEDDEESLKNRVFSVTVGYRFR